MPPQLHSGKTASSTPKQSLKSATAFMPRDFGSAFICLKALPVNFSADGLPVIRPESAPSPMLRVSHAIESA